MFAFFSFAALRTCCAKPQQKRPFPHSQISSQIQRQRFYFKNSALLCKVRPVKKRRLTVQRSERNLLENYRSFAASTSAFAGFACFAKQAKPAKAEVEAARRKNYKAKRLVVAEQKKEDASLLILPSNCKEQEAAAIQEAKKTHRPALVNFLRGLLNKQEKKKSNPLLVSFAKQDLFSASVLQSKQLLAIGLDISATCFAYGVQPSSSKQKQAAESKEEESLFYKTPQSKASAVDAVNSCLYIGLATQAPCNATMFNPYSVWSPSIYNYLQGHRENHPVLAYDQTAQKFLESLHLCALIRRRGGSIYVIFDHDNSLSDLDCIFFSALIAPNNVLDLQKPCKPKKKSLQSKATPYGWSSEKWVGGTFSNFQQVSRSVSLYGTLSRQFFRLLQQNKNVSSRYTAMHLRFQGNILSPPTASYKRLKSSLYQDKKLQQEARKSSIDLCYKKSPDVIIVENANKNRNVIHEAHALNIPIISFVDSNVAEAVLSKVSIGIGLNIYKRSFFYSLLYYIYKIPVST